MNVKHGGNIYQYEKNVIDFSSNINPLGPPAAITELFSKDWEHITRYPERSYGKLRRAIAKQQEVNPEQVLVGNGAAEIIYLLGRLFFGQKAIVPEPTFSEYSHVLKVNNSSPLVIKRKPGQNFQLPLSKIAGSLPQAAGIFLCRPNNPAGRICNLQELSRLLSPDKIIISDESFLDFVPGGEEKSLLQQLDQLPNLIVLRSSTKFYALPGLRLGYAVASAEIIEKLSQFQPPWSLNSLACRAGRIMYEQKDFRGRTLRWLQKERQFLQENLAELDDFTLFPGEANFFLLRIEASDITAGHLQQELIEHDILIRDASSFTGLNQSYFRIAVKTRSQNKKLLSALQAAADKLL